MKKARCRASSKKWREAHPENAREIKNRWKLANRDGCRERDRLWSHSNAEKMRAYRKTYRDKHKAQVAVAKAAYYRDNHEYMLERYRQHYLENREKVLLRQKAYRSRPRSVNQIRHSPDDVMRIVTRAASGGDVGQADAKGRIVYIRDGASFMLTKPINGEPATFANGGTVGLAFETKDQIDACDLRP
ncbi:VOC family protein [Mesorhizobium sp. A623]